MISSIRSTIARNRARSFVENARWNETIVEITQVMDGTLHDQPIAGTDIGCVIDQVDRMLAHLGFHTADSIETLRRRNPELARRFDQVSQQVYNMRNEMTILLVRSQVPGP